MPNLNLNTIALVSTLRPAPFNGSPSTEDYNDSQNETLLDLTSVTAFLNNILIPMLVALPDSALTGLEGRSIYGDSTDQTSLFYDSVNNESLSVSDSMRQLYALVSNSNISVSNLAIQVGQLQQRLSSTNQNNIAITLQNLTNSVNTLSNTQNSTDSAVTELQSSEAKQTTLRSAINVPANSNAVYEIDWTTAYTDNAYTVSISLQSPSPEVTVTGFQYIGTGTGVGINIVISTSTDVNVTVHLIGIHD